MSPEGEVKTPGVVGDIVVKQPLPPSCFPTIWNNAERYPREYMAPYPGYYLTGDGGYIDEDGYVFIMGRTDDVINVAGHRFSTGEMEELIAGHNAVAECAVIGIDDKLKGQTPLALIVLKDGIDDGSGIEAEIVAMGRRDIGAVACLNKVLTVARLPKTRSGKILRKTLRTMANGEDYTVPSTIDDPAILLEIQQCYDRNLAPR
jgi:propionyl-CoA synthetase